MKKTTKITFPVTQINESKQKINQICKYNFQPLDPPREALEALAIDAQSWGEEAHEASWGSHSLFSGSAGGGKENCAILTSHTEL